MEIENFEEDNLISEKQSNFPKKFLIIFIFGNSLLILFVILIIYIIINNKKNIDHNINDINNDINITHMSNDYLKYLNKLAITEKRINHLFKYKTNNKDSYDDLIQLEKLILKISWENIDKYNKEAKIELNKIISKFLSLPQNETNDNISDYLFNIMIEDKSINNYAENKNIQYILNKLKNKEDYELIKNKLNTILLYSFINLPLQFCYFSSKTDIKNNFINEVYEQMNVTTNKNICKNINTDMEEYSNNLIYMVLGANQAEVSRRIIAKNPDIPYINICNTGLRTQYLVSEAKTYLIDNINNYYVKPEYKNIMMQCTGNEIMTETIYNNFVKDSLELLNNNTIENVLITFGKYNFSIETANNAIEYLKLNVSLDDIIIIRLGEKNKKYENLKYSKDKVYILFNTIDVSETLYNGLKIMRATTEANAKAVYYLMNECKNFLKKEDYNNLVLVSNQGNAERQLEAFNIICNVLKYDIQFNSVIWNKNYENKITEKKIIDYLIEIVVKSYNLIATSIKQFNIYECEKNKDDKYLIFNNFIEEILSFTKKIS